MAPQLREIWNGQQMTVVKDNHLHTQQLILRDGEGNIFLHLRPMNKYETEYVVLTITPTAQMPFLRAARIEIRNYSEDEEVSVVIETYLEQ